MVARNLWQPFTANIQCHFKQSEQKGILFDEDTEDKRKNKKGTVAGHSLFLGFESSPYHAWTSVEVP